jgi:CO dehydrogenase/acetyl-CoA synthase delta subunit
MKNTNKKTPRWFRRGPWETVNTLLIALGLFMLMQPWSLNVFSYSFSVLLVGVVGFSIAGKLPEGD